MHAEHPKMIRDVYWDKTEYELANVDENFKSSMKEDEAETGPTFKFVYVLLTL